MSLRCANVVTLTLIILVLCPWNEVFYFELHFLFYFFVCPSLCVIIYLDKLLAVDVDHVGLRYEFQKIDKLMDAIIKLLWLLLLRRRLLLLLLLDKLVNALARHRRIVWAALSCCLLLRPGGLRHFWHTPRSHRIHQVIYRFTSIQFWGMQWHNMRHAANIRLEAMHVPEFVGTGNQLVALLRLKLRYYRIISCLFHRVLHVC